MIVADYSPQYSHWSAARSLADWLVGAGIPALTGIDTRALTRRIRDLDAPLAADREEGVVGDRSQHRAVGDHAVHRRVGRAVGL